MGDPTEYVLQLIHASEFQAQPLVLCDRFPVASRHRIGAKTICWLLEMRACRRGCNGRKTAYVTPS
nr:MAG TPA: hypothetical protein [Caudoviricetes sp.]